MAVPIDWKQVIADSARHRRIAKWVLFVLLCYTFFTTALLITTVEYGLELSHLLLYLCPLTFVFTPSAFKSFATVLSGVLAVVPLIGWALLACKQYIGRYFILITYGIVLLLVNVITVMFAVLSLRTWSSAYFEMTMYYALCTVLASFMVLAAVHYFQPKK